MRSVIHEYADAKVAARNRVLADERLRLVSEIARLTAELAEARGLLADKDYIAMKAKYNAGQLTWANMLKERERAFMGGG